MTAPTTAQVLGSYVRQNPENAWHFGTITQAGSALAWTNRAGESWPLVADLAATRLTTDATNPYHDTSPTFDLVVTDGAVTGFRFNDELYRRVAIDTGAMIPLHLNDGAGENGIAFNIDLVGDAITAATGYRILFDTGSWTTSIPLSVLNADKITYLNTGEDGKPIEVTDAWGKPCYEVSGQLGAKSSDGTTTYVIDDFKFLARVNTDDGNIICGAFPSDGPDSAANGESAVLRSLLPSLPFALALKYSPATDQGMGIVSTAPDLPINEGWPSVKCFLQLGGKPELTDLVQWRTDVPNLRSDIDYFCPEAVPGFKISIVFPNGVAELTSPQMSATVDTGSSNVRIRLGENDPQSDAAHKDFFVTPDPNYYQDVLAVKPDPGIRVRVHFEDSNQLSSSYEYPPTNDGALKVPTQTLVGAWDGDFPWAIDAQHPQKRMDLGNTIYYFCPIYYWDVTNKRVGIYVANGRTGS